MLRYVDFNITIEPDDNDDELQVRIESDNGTAIVPFQLSLGDSGTLKERLVVLRENSQTQISRGAFADDDEAPFEPKHAPLETSEIGDLLFQSVLHGRSLELFDQCSLLATQNGQGLRIKLRIDPADPGLTGVAALPWELLYRKSKFEYVGLSSKTPIVRYLDVPGSCPVFPFQQPFRILVVIANPKGSFQLNLDQEIQQIKQTWGSRPGVKAEYLENATKESLQAKLASGDFHALHFMGHGDFHPRSGQGVLLLENEHGEADRLSGQALSVLLRSKPSLRLVFLNACNTAQITDNEKINPFTGVASSLVMAGIPVVVAMQYPISDSAAISFSDKFYELLPQCHTVDWIVTESRMRVFLEQQKDDGFEWATPVLFMRSKDGKVFETEFGQRSQQASEDDAFAILNRQVDELWVQQKLDKDIPIKPPIELDKELVPKALQRTFGVADRDTFVPAGKTIATVFDENSRSLLILGDAGYGKTTSLLALAQALLRRYELDRTQPNPVVLFLSTWSDSNLSLEDWAAKEVLDKYRSSDQQFLKWLKDGRIVLLLDGLNDVAPSKRLKCIEEINRFAKTQRSASKFGGVAVCCRRDEYDRLATQQKLDCDGAIQLRPLSDEQIRSFLEKFGDTKTGLQEFLNEDAELFEDAKCPLVLGMLSEAYDMDPERFSDFVNQSTTNGDDGNLKSDSRKDLIVQTYLERTFQTEHAEGTFSRARITSSLNWLATRMHENHQTVFQMENLQPTWLKKIWHQLFYCIIYGISVGLIMAASLSTIWYVSNVVDKAFPAARQSDQWIWVLAPLWAVLVTGASLVWRSSKWSFDSTTNSAKQVPMPGLYDRITALGTKLRVPRTLLHSVAETIHKKRIRYAVLWIAFLFLLWMALWLFVSFLVCDWRGPESKEDLLLPDNMDGRTWISHSITGGIIVSILYGLRTFNFSRTFIGTSESLKWDWSRALKGSGLGLGVGLLVWVAYWNNYRGNPNGLNATGLPLTNNLFLYPPMGVVTGFLFGGFRRRILASKSVPNEGVKLSLRNGIIGGVVFTLAIAITLVPILMSAFSESSSGTGNETPIAVNYANVETGQTSVDEQPPRFTLANMQDKWFPALLLGCGCGLVAFVWFGGADFLRHYCLRIVLLVTRQLPWRIAKLCDQMADLILLQKIGGGYIFRNHLLRDYFAGSDNTEISEQET